MKSGKLTVICYDAELTHDMELFGKMSPFL